MKVYALGIIAVLFLSVGYSAYQNAEASREVALALAREIPELRRTPTFRRLQQTEEIEIAQADLSSETGSDEAELSIEEAAPVHAVKVAGSRPRARASRVSQRSHKTAKAPAFTDTVIYYKEPDRSLLADTRASGVLTRREERRSNKSLLSKTFSVVKKPYDWVKTAVSKLD